MEIWEIIRRIQEIGDIDNNADASHEAQDKLYVDFITYVSNCNDCLIAEQAKEVLKVSDLRFDRYYS